MIIRTLSCPPLVLSLVTRASLPIPQEHAPLANLHNLPYECFSSNTFTILLVQFEDPFATGLIHTSLSPCMVFASSVTKVVRSCCLLHHLALQNWTPPLFGISRESPLLWQCCSSFARFQLEVEFFFKIEGLM